MSNFSKLVKPYYTLEETYRRLKSSGAEISSAEDILLLWKDKKICVKLLCDEFVTLIKTENAVIAKCKIPHDYRYEDLLDAGYTQKQIERFVREIERSECLITDDQRHFITIDADSRPVPLTPLVTLLGHNERKSKFYEMPLAHYTAALGSLLLSNMSVVNLDGETYYICRSIESNPVASLSCIENDNHQNVISLTHAMDTSLLLELIKKGNYVVTTESILNFETEWLSEYKDEDENSQEELPKQDGKLSWKDVLINKPKIHSGKFEQTKTAVEALIAESGLPPKVDDVIEFLDMKDKYEKTNLRKAWSRYTQTEDKA